MVCLMQRPSQYGWFPLGLVPTLFLMHVQTPFPLIHCDLGYADGSLGYGNSPFLPESLRVSCTPEQPIGLLFGKFWVQLIGSFLLTFKTISTGKHTSHCSLRTTLNCIKMELKIMGFHLSRSFGRAQIWPTYPGNTLSHEQTQLHSRLIFSKIR